MPPGLLARFPNLCSLSLTRCSCDQHGSWTPAVLPAVLNLQLTELDLVVPSHPPELLADFARSLPQLRYLTVCTNQPLQHAGRLTSLIALQQLILNEVTMEGACLQPPLLAQLPSLEQYVVAPGRHRGADRAFQVSASSSLQGWGRSFMRCFLPKCGHLLDPTARSGTCMAGRLRTPTRVPMCSGLARWLQGPVVIPLARQAAAAFSQSCASLFSSCPRCQRCWKP